MEKEFSKMKSRRIISLSTLFIALLSAPLSAKETVTVWSWFVQGTMQKSIEAFEKNNPDI
ncbi:hypothetical protein VINI7043_03385, partial [Vibrio nigripulchritudo ATCC 27043]